MMMFPDDQGLAELALNVLTSSNGKDQWIMGTRPGRDTCR